LQHTPSTQLPEPHSAPEAHVVPSGLEHVPSPFALHLSGAMHELTVQHTPSTQLPLAHCDGDVHTVPGVPVVTQVVPLQK
jgi:hypothetical protein